VFQKVQTLCRCDNGACLNPAEYAFFRTDTDAGNRLYLCGECLKAIAEASAKLFGPRSAVNMVKRAEEKRKENFGGNDGEKSKV